MRRFFEPKSVALVGASTRPNTLSAVLLRNLLRGGYGGDVYLVNPHADAIAGVRCYPQVGELPAVVDLALLMVPAREAEETLRQCAQHGIRRAVVLAAGFRETGEEGGQREQRLGRLARAAGMRLIGPNSMGLMNLACSPPLNASFSPAPATPGAAAFITQSGALGVAVQQVAAQWPLGFSQFVSLGNESDVTAAELVEYCLEQPSTRVVLLYLESLGHGRELLECGRRLCRRKPLVLLLAGRTEAGAAAAASHTGALVTRPEVAEGVFSRAGFLVARSLEEMLEMGLAFSQGRLPAGTGRSIAILTNAGGPGVLATDAAVAGGLELAALQAQTTEALRQLAPQGASLRNPIDLLPLASDHLYASSARSLLADPGVEQLLVLKVSSPLGPSPPGLLDGLAALADECRKPVLGAWMVPPDSPERQAAAIPLFWFPDGAARAAAALARYAQIRAASLSEQGPPASIPAQTTRAKRPISSVPAMDQLFGLLEDYGIACAPFVVASSCPEAAEFAARHGYPLVLKTREPAIVHKTEAGGVLEIRDEAELRRSFEAVPGAASRGVLVQKLVRGQHREVLAGFLRDRRLGPLLAFGVGGTAVEALGQVGYLALPASPAEVRDLVLSAPAAMLLGSFRGRAPVAVDRLVEALLALASLGLDHPQIAAVEINPLLAGAGSEETLAVDARLVLEQNAEQARSETIGAPNVA